MDSRQMEQKFDAIYMAIMHGQLTAARSAFKISIQIAIDGTDKLTSENP